MSHLYFIGRTPENFFDYLSGIFDDIDEKSSINLAQFSMRGDGNAGLNAISSQKTSALFEYFKSIKLDAASIANAPRPVALIDYVALGGTFRNLVNLLHLQAKQDRVDWNAVQRRLILIGVRMRTKNSPNTWRWQQNQNWLGLIPDATIKNVSADPDFIHYLANHQPKVTFSFHMRRWGNSRQAYPKSLEQAKALAFALALYDHGRSKSERQAFAARLSQHTQMKYPNVRKLVTCLKRTNG